MSSSEPSTLSLRPPFSEPAIDSFSLSFRNLMHSKIFQWQTPKAFAGLEFVGSIETWKFYNYVGKITFKNSMNRFYWESI